MFIFVDNEDELTKFANTAYNKFLRNLKEKPKEVPEELYTLKLKEDKLQGKRSRTQTNKIKESKEQEKEMSSSPKKKKSSDKIKESLEQEKEMSSSPKKKKASECDKGKREEVKSTCKTLAKEKAEKKKLEETASRKSAVHLSDVLAQFLGEDDDVLHTETKQISQPPASMPVICAHAAQPISTTVSHQLPTTAAPQSTTAAPQSTTAALQSTTAAPQSTTASQPLSNLASQPLSNLLPQPLSNLASQLTSTSASQLLCTTQTTSQPLTTQSTQLLQQNFMPPVPSSDTSMLETWNLCMETNAVDNSKKIPGIYLHVLY